MKSTIPIFGHYGVKAATTLPPAGQQQHVITAPLVIGAGSDSDSTRSSCSHGCGDGGGGVVSHSAAAGPTLNVFVDARRRPGEPVPTLRAELASLFEGEMGHGVATGQPLHGIRFTLRSYTRELSEADVGELDPTSDGDDAVAAGASPNFPAFSGPAGRTGLLLGND